MRDVLLEVCLFIESNLLEYVGVYVHVVSKNLKISHCNHFFASDMINFILLNQKPPKDEAFNFSRV